MRILLSCYSATIVAYTIARSTSGGEQSLFGALTIVLGFSSLLLSIATLAEWCEEQEAKRDGVGRHAVKV